MTTLGTSRAGAQEELVGLLRSLDDLDAELAAGDLDPDDYARLRDDYTARAAALSRALDEPGVTRMVPVKPVRRWRRVAVWTTVVAFAAGAAWLATATLGQRLPGQTATGNAQSGPESSARALAAAVKDDPSDVSARLAYARFLLRNDRPVDALKQFDAASRLDPDDGESRAYSGWLVYQAGLVDEARRRLDEAIRVAPDYPDAHLFRGILLLRAANDRAGAAAEIERYIALSPAGPLAAEVRALLDEARAGG